MHFGLHFNRPLQNQPADTTREIPEYAQILRSQKYLGQKLVAKGGPFNLSGLGEHVNGTFGLLCFL